MRTITAKFASKCQATGQAIKRGELISYDPETKQAYKLGKEPQESQEQAEARSIRNYINDQEEIDEHKQRLLERGVSCTCDNCYHRRTQLAKEILRLRFLVIH